MQRSICLTIAVVVVALTLLVPSRTSVVWDGHYDATVHIISEPNLPSAVCCQAVFRAEEAQLYVHAPWHTHLAEPSALGHIAADPFDGKPLKFSVQISGRDSTDWMGRRTSKRSEPLYLVVMAKWRDGRTSGQVVDLPAVREADDVTLTVRLP